MGDCGVTFVSSYEFLSACFGTITLPYAYTAVEKGYLAIILKIFWYLLCTHRQNSFYGGDCGVTLIDIIDFQSEKIVRRKTKLPELLAPAGDLDCLYAAVDAGADAIYVGGKRFGARAYAKNFDIDELSSAVRYCHLHGVRLYVTINTLLEDGELADAIEYSAQLYALGIDAVIVADLGLIREIRRLIPELEVHASTQMSVHNTRAAEVAADMGCPRVVVARELSLRDIQSIVDGSRCEVEVFLHGALCVCHSGQCLFSSMVGGRSGNRGECAQPCRLPYNNGKYPLSLKDLSLSHHVRELIDSGVASLKIEGRMKSPSYVHTVVSVYRALLDEYRDATSDEDDRLRRAFSRGGFTDGYIKGKLRSGMTGIRSDADKEDSRSEVYEPVAKKISVRAEVTMRLGERCTMTLTDGVRTVTAYGEAPRPAERSPLVSADVCARLSKMGNTNLSLAVEDITLTLDEGVNLAPSEINALRRSAAETFEDCSRARPSIERTDYIAAARAAIKPMRYRTAQFMRESEFLRVSDAADSFIDISFVPIDSSAEAFSSARGVSIPPIVFDSEISEVTALLAKARECGAEYALVGNIGHISLAREAGLIPIGDFRLNITNAQTMCAIRDMGIEHAVLSPELTLPKARDIGGGVITLGRIPLMITERCFTCENFGCDKCNNASLTDRRGEKFPLMREFSHRNLVINSAVTYMGDRADELKKNRISGEHFVFTVESADKIREYLKKYRTGAPLSEQVRRVGRREVKK